MMDSHNNDDLKDWEVVSRREWLATNGLGGYASSSVACANTRRYHGLLVPAFSPPLGRAVLLSKLEEEVRVEDQLYLLSANKYPSVVMPQGFRHLTYFETYPVPTFTYVFHEDTVVLEKRVWMAYGKNTVYVRYTLIASPEPVKLGFVPLLAYKDYHTEQHRWDGFHGDLTQDPDGRRKFVAFDDAHPMWIDVDAPFNFKPESGWFYNFEHCREEDRGLDHSEDLYCPGRFDGTLSVGQSVTFIATVETDVPETSDIALRNEKSRKSELLRLGGHEPNDTGLRATLLLAADQFIVQKSDRAPRATVIAGYHWFTDWGRDTMISLPGLCLPTGRLHIAKEILTSFAAALHEGLLPNRFTDNGTGAEYNTVDATLWFFNAVYHYAQAGGEDAFVNSLLPAFEAIIDCHNQGTMYGIGVDPTDGLLAAGQPGVQLTWMDAKVGDWVVTPRIGKPVEINALWYNALRITATLAQAAGAVDRANLHNQNADKVQKSFHSVFVNSATNTLFDVISRDGTPDPAVRPNQIFAVSLPFPIVTGELAKSIVQQVRSELLTDCGLRTLSPKSPEYHAHYGPGDQGTRDAAYHQGTVWPWLIGAYIDACKAISDCSIDPESIIRTLCSHASSYGQQTVNEIFDAEAPYNPNGCIAQAWSVAEALRVLPHPR